MATSTATADRVSSDPDTQVASLWVPPRDRKPTETDEIRARKHSLQVGNKTEVGVDCSTDHYKPYRISEAKKNWYKHLDKHNRDNNWEYRNDIDVSVDVDRQLRLKTTLAITSQLSLTKRQAQIVVERMFEIDGRRFGQRTEAVALCLCAIVMNEEAERCGTEKVYHPQRSDRKNGSEFVRVQNQLIASFGPITKPRLTSIYNKLKQGQPPLRQHEETRIFVKGNTKFQCHPSYAPDHALPRPTSEG